MQKDEDSMIQRKPVVRAFTGLVGLPPEPTPTPATVASAASTQVAPEMKCEYRRYKDGPWICLYCRHRATDDDITAEGVPASRVCSVQNINQANREAALKDFEKKHAEKERRAAAARAKRKEKADQLAAIKEALRTPVAVIIAEAKEEAEVCGQKLKSVWSNHYQTGGGKEFSGGDYVGSKLAEEDAPKTGRVTPEGVGQRFGSQGTPDEDSAPDPWTANAEAGHSKAPIIGGQTFKVRLNNKEEKNPAHECIPDFFIEMTLFRYRVRCTNCGAKQDDDESIAEDYFTCWQCGTENGSNDLGYICRLCGLLCDGLRRAAYHIENVHGDPTLPAHNARFGDVLRRWVKGGKKAPNIEKAHRKVKMVTP